MKTYKFKINGNDYAVAINSIEDNMAEVTVNDVAYAIEIEGAAPQPKVSKPAPVPMAIPSAVAAPSSSAGAAGDAMRSPLPGVIISVGVKEGDAVKVGQRLLVLEAMKMENNIDADRDGVVKSIAVRQGDSVLEGDVLLTIG